MSHASTCPESAPGEAILPGRNREVVGLNIHESRTWNFVRELERRGFRVTQFATPDWRTALRHLLPFLKAVLRADSVLCGNVLWCQLPWIFLTKLLRRPLILDFPMDITEWPFLTLRGWRWLVALTLRLADGVLTIRSRAYVIDKFRLKPQRIRFLESCPDPAAIHGARNGKSRFHPRPGAFVICWSGGHLHHRLERFMPVFEALAGMLPHAELVLIADPNQESVVESQRYARQAGLAERVHAIPVIVPPQDFYATVSQCHLWVATLGDDTLQGRQELRMELLEVGLLGKAVVAAPTPGLLEHGFTGGRDIVYIDPSDPQASARKIAELAQNPALLDQLGERLRTRVSSQFSLAEGIDATLDLFARGGPAVPGK